MDSTPTKSEFAHQPSALLLKMQATVSALKARKHRHKQRHFLIRAAYVLIGSLMLVAAAIMVVMPGPAVLVFPVGLAVLALEFAWAERMLDKALAHAHKADQTLAQSTRKQKLIVSIPLLTAGSFAAFAVLFNPSWIPF